VGGRPAGHDRASVAALRAKVAELGADNVAAFFCEPIQGSGGVIVPPKGWLKAMRDAAANSTSSSSSTKSSPASAAPARCSPAKPKASSRT
jgi:hypothetical protein